MKNKIEYKNKLLEQRALLEALIKQNKKYFKNDQVSGFEFCKYLEKIQKAYDDFLFEKTSKISIEDIKERLKQEQEKKKNEKKVRTPYTIEFESKRNFTLVIIIVIAVLLLVVFYLLLKNVYL